MYIVVIQMTLYLKYRPQTIEELDLASVRESLKKVLKSESIPHAFLFAGPRGAGKTSAARILAKALNCVNLKDGEPCNECEQCRAINAGNHVDIIEMDAASNRGIDDIRALRESVGLSPQSAKKKVYIIDEAHMLTTEASNAFLKTLEEPPSHVQFIFATTDPQKLPETIKSRLHTIQFTKANSEEISRQLERVISGEKMKVEDGVVNLIASSVDGSFRDAVKKLEALSLGNAKITLEQAEKYIYQSTEINISELLKLLAAKEGKKALEAVQRYSDNGGDAKLLIEQLIEKIRLQLLAEYGIGEGSESIFSGGDALQLIELLMEARSNVSKSHIPQLSLEIAISKWVGALTKTKEIPKKVEAAPVIEKVEIKVEGKPAPDSVEGMLERKIEAMKGNAPVAKVSDSTDSQVWPKILAQAKNTNTTVEALLRAAELLEFDGEMLKLGVYYQFHKESLESGKNRQMLDTIVQQVCGPVKVSLMLTQPHAQADALTDANDEDIIEAAKEIFGE